MSFDTRFADLCGRSLLLAAAIATSGCDEDADTGGSADAATEQADASRSDDAGQSDAGKRNGHLIVVTERETPEASIQYLHVLNKWPEDGKLAYDQAVELGDAVSVHTLGDAVFVYQRDDVSVRKLVVKQDGTVDEDKTVSFTAQGAVGASGDMIYASSTRAYFLDETSQQFVVWNPTTMEVLGAFDVDKDVLSRDDIQAQISDGVGLGGEGFVSMSWRDWETFSYHDATALGVFDATSLEPKLRIIEDDRCASNIMPPYEGDDGFVYIVSDAASGFDAIASPMRTKKGLCVLRIKPGATEFDKDFFVDLKEILVGSPGFFATYPLSQGKLLVNLWAPDVDVESVATPDDSNWYWDYPPYFEYAIVDLEAGTAIPVPDLERAAVQWSLILRVDGDTYVQTYRDNKGSDLQRVDPDGTVTRVLSNGPDTDVQFLGRLER